MRLHWFREHKQIVYWVLCPAVVLSMSLFGIASFTNRGSGSSGSSGPGVSYTVGNKEVYQSPSEVFQKRQQLYKFEGGGDHYIPKSNRDENNPTTDNIALWLAENETARQYGFEVGFEELKEILRNTVTGKIKAIDNLKEVTLTEDIYEKLLSQIDMSRAQFENTVYELALREKFHENIIYSIVISDPQLYVKYCQAKEVVRLRYRTLKSDDFIAAAKAPSEGDIKTEYDKYLDKKDDPQHKDYYKFPATMSVEALAYKDEKIFADVKPTEEELKTYYNNTKGSIEGWKDPKNTADPFWPLATVHAEVEKKWKDDKLNGLKNTVSTNFAKALKELTDAEDVFKKDEKNKDKTFDVPAFAKAHNMVYWVTPEQTRETFGSGKLEVNAPDVNVGSSLWSYADLTGNAPPSSLADKKKHMFEFTSFRWIDNNKPELGGIVGRAKTFNDEKTKTYAEAKEKVIERLKILESTKLMKEAADKLHEDWRQGKNLPKLDELDEITSDKNTKDKDGVEKREGQRSPLVQMFRHSPKANGEVLDVAEGAPEGEKVKYDPDKKWCYVGCAVERKLPTTTQFASAPEADFSREDARNGKYMYGYRMQAGIREEDAKSTLAMMVFQIKTGHVIIVGNKENEPDLRRLFRGAPTSDE